MDPLWSSYGLQKSRKWARSSRSADRSAALMTGQPDDPYRIFRPVRTRRSFEEAVEQIADAIRLGDLRRGDRLPSERELAARMQVSRQTLREAIRVVSKAELVRVDPGPGGGMSIQ